MYYYYYLKNPVIQYVKNIEKIAAKWKGEIKYTVLENEVYIVQKETWQIKICMLEEER